MRNRFDSVCFAAVATVGAAACTIPALPAFAQTGETSHLVPSVALPDGAIRVTAAPDVKAFGDLLNAILKPQKVHAENVEVDVFRGTDVDAADRALNALRTRLGQHGFATKQGARKSAGELTYLPFTAEGVGQQIFGLVCVSPKATTLMWGEAKPGAIGAASSQPSAPTAAPSSPSNNGSVRTKIAPLGTAPFVRQKPAAQTGAAAKPLPAAAVPPPAMISGTGDLYFYGRTFPGTMVFEYVYLDRAGHILHVLPPHGSDPVNWQEASATVAPDAIGTYTMGGGKLNIRWKNGKSESWDCTPEEGSLRIQGAPFVHAPKFPKGHRLNGHFSFAAFSARDVAGGGRVTASSSTTFDFRPDGTFDGGSAGSASMSPNGGFGHGAYAEGPSLAGHYYIWGNTLLMSFADGRQERHTIYTYNGDESKAKPDMLGIDGQMGLFN